MTAPNNDVLAERIDNLITKMDEFMKNNTRDHNKLFQKFDDIEEKYITRKELKAVKRAWGAVMALIWLLATLWIITK